MKQLNLRALLSSFAVVGLLLFVSTPAALAHEIENGDDNKGGLTKITTTSADDTPALTTAQKAKVEDRVKQNKADGQAKLDALRAKLATKSTAQRQKACEQRKGSISNRITAYDKAANNKLTQFNTIFERVKKFKTDKALQVSNYDALVATATEKQTAATESVAALKDLSADFDCTATDPGATVASIKSATVDARTTLKEYRKSIKDIVVALAQVNKSSSSDDDSTDDNSTTTTTTDSTTTKPEDN